MRNLFHACIERARDEIKIVREHHRPTRAQYRAMLLLGGAALYIVHMHAPEYEINVVLALHGMVTLDPTA